LLAFINKNLEDIRKMISLFYGPRYNRKELAERFHNWRKSVGRDPIEKDNIIFDGSRSQNSVFSKQWRWVMVQAVLWLIISFKFSFSPVINLMAFFTILNQFINNILIISKDKRQMFNTFITQEILSTKSFSLLLLETLDDLDSENNDSVNIGKMDYAPDCEWTDISLKLVHNKFDKSLPLIQINIGHESSELFHPSLLGLVNSSDIKKQNSSLMILKLFGRHNNFIFDGHNSQKKSIVKKIQALINTIIIYFGDRDISPIVQNEITGSWDCFINIIDTTDSWYQIEKERDQDINNLLLEWVPLEDELERVDQAAESYKMKGYEW